MTYKTKMKNETKTVSQARMLLAYIKRQPLASIKSEVRGVLLHDLELIANPSRKYGVTRTDTETPRAQHNDLRYGGGIPLSGVSSTHRYSKTN